MRLHPAEFYGNDVEQTIFCDNCGRSHDDVAVTIYDSLTVADCPVCDMRIEVYA